jgi:hypothetical protein
VAQAKDYNIGFVAFLLSSKRGLGAFNSVTLWYQQKTKNLMEDEGKDMVFNATFNNISAIFRVWHYFSWRKDKSSKSNWIAENFTSSQQT